MHREVSMYESRPEQQRGREQWTVLSGTSTIGHGLHVADRAQGLTERGKVPSAARVACIARSACTSLDQNSNKQLFERREFLIDTSLYTNLVRIRTFSKNDFPFDEIYRRLLFFTTGTSIYYCCKSFPVLLHDVMVDE